MVTVLLEYLASRKDDDFNTFKTGDSESWYRLQQQRVTLPYVHRPPPNRTSNYSLRRWAGCFSLV